jgi:signal recognition particle receptor subunit beta
MVQINFGQREVSCKLVYYGPGMSGKTTNLEIIHQKAPDNSKGEMVSIATETDRTLYFDYLPLDLGQVAGMHTKFQLYTVPGQIYYNATRKLVLQGVDGVIFVADSAKDKMAENLESLQNLRDNLADMSLNLDDLPVVIQYNKRDLPNALPVSVLNEQMNPMGVPCVEAISKDGKGVFSALKLLSKLVIEKLNTEHAPAAQRRRTASDLRPASASSSGTPPGSPINNQAAAPPPASAPAPSRPAPAAAAPPPRQAPPSAPTPRAASALASKTRNTSSSGRHPARHQAPTQGGASPQERRRHQHLRKPAPTPLAHSDNPPQPVNLGQTDPGLRRYKTNPGGGLIKAMMVIVLTLVFIILILGVLVMFVKPVRDAVRPLLPTEFQKMLLDESQQKAAEAAATSNQSAPAPDESAP